MLGGSTVREIIELHAQGKSIRQIAKLTGQSRNSIRKYLRNPGLPVARARPKRGSALAPYTAHLQARLQEGVANAVVLLREIRTLGYPGGYTTLKNYLRPHRLQREIQTRQTIRFETEMGEQAQVDFGQYSYRDLEGQTRRVWAFVMVLGWSRALYVEFIQKADTSAFLRCHVNALQYFGGVPLAALYDNTKLVVLSRDEQNHPVWNERFLDFSLRMGFSARLCQPYRPRTKGKVERGVGYVEGNFWPTARFTDLDDLNAQGRLWLESVANVRQHGTTRERPIDRLHLERSVLRSLPDLRTLRKVMSETRKVGWDGFISYEGSYYGVPWVWMGLRVEVLQEQGQIKIYGKDELIASHSKIRPGERQTTADQWQQPQQHNSPEQGKSVVAHQVALPAVDVEQRPLAHYAEVAELNSGGIR